MNRRGFFMAVDGPSGAGKSTVVRLLAARLADAGHTVTATAEPTGSPLGTAARAGTHDYHGLTLACLVAADRYHHLAETIEPALSRGDIVICDRYVPSTLVLQRLDGVDAHFLRQLNAHATIPDLTVILTADPGQCIGRTTRRGASSRFHDRTLGQAQTEDAMYRSLVDQMRTDGQPVLHIDHTSGLTAERIAARLATTLPAPGYETGTDTASWAARTNESYVA